MTIAPATLPRIKGVLTDAEFAQTQDRLIGLRNELALNRTALADAAEANKRATRRREEAVATAAGKAPGTPTEKRWAALEAVGDEGLEEEARYARLRAEVDVIFHEVIANASLLKSANARHDVGRYEDGP